MIETAQIGPARADIQAFVTWVLDFLERLQDGRNVETDDGPLFEPMALTMFRDAWPSFRADFADSGWTRRVQDARATDLQSHGLYGVQLAAKLWLVRYLLQRFLDCLAPADRERLSLPVDFGGTALLSAEVHARRRSEPGRPKGLFKRLIEVIDIPLDSIQAALGIDGAITEAKKLLGASVDE